MKTPPISFVLLLMTTVTLFLRPAELFAALEGAPIYECLILGCLVTSANALQRQLNWRAIVRQPITLCVLGIIVAIAFSHLTHGYFGGALEGVTAFAKVLVLYFLVLAIVTTTRRMHRFLLTIAVCGTLMVSLCTFDFYGFVDFPFIEHLADYDGEDEEGETLQVLRMRGTGIFQDPNDLAMVIVACSVLAGYFLTEKRYGFFRWLWLLPFGVLGAGLLATGSRGGLLAGAAAVAVFASIKGGVRTAIAVGVCGALALPLVAGRQAKIELGDSTGGERVGLWRDGFDALKSPDLVFGVGQNGFSDIAGLVAHNSYVHAYVELGLFGGTLYFGAFFFAFYQLWRLGGRQHEIDDPRYLRMRPYVVALLAGWCVSTLSLSRCYVVPTYLILATMAAYTTLAARTSESHRPLAVWNRRQGMRLAFASAVAFVGLYLTTVFLI